MKHNSYSGAPSLTDQIQEGRCCLETEMLGVRCILSDLSRRLQRCVHQRMALPIRSVTFYQHDHHHIRLTQRRGLSQEPNPSLKEAKIKLRSRLLVALVFGSGLLGTWYYVYLEKQQKLRLQRIEQLKKVALGQGNFSLVDHNGQRRTKQDFLGSWVLLYFGFTHCPDICPDELEKMSAVVSALEQDRSLPKVQPVFITVDPERDTVPALARYVKDFHPRLIGLTGTPEEVKHAGRDYRVYASPGPKDDDGDYIVDHTILIYLISPNGLFLDYYNRMKSQEQITESIRNHIKTYIKL